MKLFKKLAAVALVGVMALSMVGCGKGGTGTSYKSELTNLLKDSVSDGDTVENTKELDDAAAILLANAQSEYGKLDADAQKNVTESQITDWLTDEDAAAKAEGLKDKYCKVSFAEDRTYISSTANQFKYLELMLELVSDSGSGDNQGYVGDQTKPNTSDDMKVGFARGKIGSKTYIVMLMY